MSDQGPQQPIFQSSTEAFAPGSDTPIPVRVGHAPEDVRVLSPDEYRYAAKEQAERDAEFESQTEPDPKALAHTNPPKSKPTQGAPKLRIAPNPDEPVYVNPRAIAKPQKGKGAGPRNGKPSPEPSTTSLPAPSSAMGDPRVDQLQSRLDSMEVGQNALAQGLNRVVELLSARQAHQPAIDAEFEVLETREEERKANCAARRPPDEVASLIEEDLDESITDDPETWPERVLVPEDEFEPGDPALARLQQFIARKQPLKDFRRWWYQVCPKAAYQEWPSEMQETFAGLFQTIILHPKMLTQVRRTMATFRNGAVVGEEQLYRVLVVLAGSCALYSIVTKTQGA